MSTTIPPVETTPHPDIVAAKTPLDVANAVLANPALKAVVDKYAGDPNGLPAALAGLLVTYFVTAGWLKLDPTTAGSLTLVAAAVIGYGWQIVSRMLTPATPVTGGTTP